MCFCFEISIAADLFVPPNFVIRKTLIFPEFSQFFFSQDIYKQIRTERG